MVIGPSSGACTAVLTVPTLQDSGALTMAAVEVLSHGRPRTQTASNWRIKGEVCHQPSAQGGRMAGYGAYDVTDTKFSTSMGPPSCSPPV